MLSLDVNLASKILKNISVMQFLQLEVRYMSVNLDGFMTHLDVYFNISGYNSAVYTLIFYSRESVY